MSKLTQETLEKSLIKYGLNYHVDTFKEKNPFNGKFIGSFGTYRTDSLEVLKTGFSKRYLPIQNRDAFSVIATLQEHKESLTIHSMGHLKGKPFAKLNFGQMDVKSNKVGDIVNKFVYFVNSFDGTSSLKFKIFLERLVCSNGMVSSEMTDSWSFSHTINSSNKVSGLINTLKIVDGVFQKTEDNYNVLANTSIKENFVDDFLNEVFPLDESKKRLNTINTKAQDTIKQYYNNCDNGFIPHGTAWSLYNAVTRYYTHDRGIDKNGDTKEHSLVFGNINAQMKGSLNLINEMV